MERFVKGDVVVLPFPFSDLSSSKKRPALIVAKLKGDDFVLCQITSELKFDKYSLVLSNKDFSQGMLKHPSRIRPNRLFTPDKSIVLYRIGSLKKFKIVETQNKLINIFTN